MELKSLRAGLFIKDSPKPQVPGEKIFRMHENYLWLVPGRFEM
jgi:hypothetical protein